MLGERITTKLSFEAWRQQDNGFLQGLAYHLQGSDTLLTESMGMYEFRGQTLNFAGFTPDPASCLFSLTHFDDKRWVFENVGSQYPQRIVYEFPKADSLTVTLECARGRERRIG